MPPRETPDKSSNEPFGEQLEDLTQGGECHLLTELLRQHHVAGVPAQSLGEHHEELEDPRVTVAHLQYWQYHLPKLLMQSARYGRLGTRRERNVLSEVSPLLRRPPPEG